MPANEAIFILDGVHDVASRRRQAGNASRRRAWVWEPLAEGPMSLSVYSTIPSPSVALAMAMATAMATAVGFDALDLHRAQQTMGFTRLGTSLGAVVGVPLWRRKASLGGRVDRRRGTYKSARASAHHVVVWFLCLKPPAKEEHVPWDVPRHIE